MGDTQGRSRFIAVTGTVAALLSFSWFIRELQRSAVAVARSDVYSAMLFVGPLAVLVIVVAATWFLLTREIRRTDAGERTRVLCGCCERSISQEWRLCPYCGSRVEDAPPIAEPGQN